MNKTFFIIFAILIFVLGAGVASASLKDAFGTPLTDVAGPKGAGYDTAKTADPDALIGPVIQAVISFVGVIFLVLMIYGGFLWMTARGESTQIEKAKNLISAAIVGLIIVVSAYAISSFVMKQFADRTLVQ